MLKLLRFGRRISVASSPNYSAPIILNREYAGGGKGAVGPGIKETWDMHTNALPPMYAPAQDSKWNGVVEENDELREENMGPDAHQNYNKWACLTALGSLGFVLYLVFQTAKLSDPESKKPTVGRKFTLPYGERQEIPATTFKTA